MHDTGAAGTPTCRNCSAALMGPFCHACGQKDLDPDITVREVLHDAAQEATDIDGKLIRTLRLLLTRPGSLTLETLDGRRARYASPFRLYLTCSVLLFALVALAPRPDSVITFRGPALPANATPEQVIAQRQFEARVVDAISESIQTNMPRLMFVLMPLFAVLTWSFYRRSRRRYIPHLYFALHLHSFIFLVLSVQVLLSFAGNALDPIAVALLIAIGVYLFLSLRRVFGGGILETALKGTAIAGLYLIALALALVAVTYPVVARIERGELPAPDPPSTASPAPAERH